MSRVDKGAGFTIIEVLIVLGVTGMLLLIAINLVTGQSGPAEFEQSARVVFSELQNITNHISIGYYGQFNGANFTCSYLNSSTTPTILTSGGGVNTEGTNGGNGSSSTGCIFLGKVIQFAPSDLGSPLTKYVDYTVTGRQYQISPNTNVPVTDFAGANTYVVHVASNTSNADVLTAPYGIQFSKIYYTDSSQGATRQYTDLVGFFSNFAAISGSSQTQLTSGSQGVSLVPLVTYASNSSPAWISTTTAINLINGFYESPTGSSSIFSAAGNSLPGTNTVVNPSGGVTICMNSGTSNQNATIQIGTSQNPFAMSLNFASGVCS